MARLLTFIAGTGFRGRACPRPTLKTEKEKANLISQTGLYLMPATTGFYPEVKPKDSHTLSRAVQSVLVAESPCLVERASTTRVTTGYSTGS
jgi:hypothetical protein